MYRRRPRRRGGDVHGCGPCTQDVSPSAHYVEALRFFVLGPEMPRERGGLATIFA